MIQRIVSFALKFRAIVVASTLLVIFGGVVAFSELDIEAYPNPSPPLVETLVQPMGWSAEEVERYVTIPMEVGLSGIPGLTYLRSMSLFSLSDVKCYFAWGTDYWADRQEVINRMTTWIQLPNGLSSQISPWNAIGEVFRYTLEGKGYTLTDKKTAEDWLMEHQWRQVQGVIDVTSYGGTTKQYHVDVDPYRLRGHGVTLTQTVNALQNANANVGGQRLSIGEQSYDIRGIGLLGYFDTPLTDINNVDCTRAADEWPQHGHARPRPRRRGRIHRICAPSGDGGTRRRQRRGARDRADEIRRTGRPRRSKESRTRSSSLKSSPSCRPG